MQKTGKCRQTIDQFYTADTVAKKCIATFMALVQPSNDSLIVEPSAGTGAFSNHLSVPHRAYDIEPKGTDIVKQDFLTLDLAKLRQETGATDLHFLGNPPFGRQSALARRFIRHICACPDTASIAFILPKSFKKTSFQKTFPLCYHLFHSEDLGDNSFVLNGAPYTVPCVFQIWVRCATDRCLPEILSPVGYAFVKKDAQHHFSIRRVGVNAGHIDTCTQNKSPQSHYFIRLDHDTSASEFFLQFKGIVFDHDNTVGPRSISKQELIRATNSLPCCKR